MSTQTPSSTIIPASATKTHLSPIATDHRKFYRRLRYRHPGLFTSPPNADSTTPLPVLDAEDQTIPPLVRLLHVYERIGWWEHHMTHVRRDYRRWQGQKKGVPYPAVLDEEWRLIHRAFEREWRLAVGVAAELRG